MKTSRIVVPGFLFAVAVFALSASASAPAAPLSGAAATLEQVASPTAPRPIAPARPVSLAQGEGDVDESHDSRPADTDEEMETDTAKTPKDTTRQVPAAKTVEPPAKPGETTKTPAAVAMSPEAVINKLIKGIRWFGQSAFLVQDGKNIYLDPFELGGELPPADIILITHDHYDHLSPADVAKIIKPTTVVVSIQSALDKLPKTGIFRVVKPGDTLTVEGVRIEAVPAYNISKQYHPKAKGYVGFIIRTGGRSIYDAGDTDLIPEMKNFKADVALLPIGGKYTMDASEAAKAANLLGPKLAIPMHFGKIVGTDADAKTFKAETKVPVVILKPEVPPVKEEKKSK